MAELFDPLKFASALGVGNLAIWFAAAALLFYAIYSLILLYHWLRYGINPFTVFIMMALYFGVSLPLAGIVWRTALAL
ncbi:hypothetical protein A3D66_02485 [Candidatus Kaiserbacteria bacterium RIFCSPHIGHO2_02_FULL_50_9]|nr:MAG: hypothetical protein A2761_03170 [Candidatus Kaiserbacteria bacterium RIFCSPHIGHO2_01_FULL_51_33]OGG63804.1 MAG: hypothetical protein A3D66_02485 [Candidatus Kaiserbacteria bacterium RIFCSPHIGHO2_02_FULL_50_9]